MKMPLRSLLLGALAAGWLGGCAELPFFGGSTPGGAHPRAVADEGPDSALRDGLRLYHEGDFNGAIRRLSARDVMGGSRRTRLTALKYTAFSYCVTGRPAPCRHSFDQALNLDPGFMLTPGERGHPLWGPVFEQARAAR